MDLGLGFPGLVGGQHLLRALGVQVDNLVQRFEALGDAMEDLQHLADGFGHCGGLSPQGLGSLLNGGGIAGAGYMGAPNMGCCPCAGSYAQPQQLDFGASRPGAGFFEKLASRKQGAKLERFLQKNPFARQQLEMMLGGQIIPDGCRDGKITVQPFPQGGFAGPGQQNFAAAQALGALDQITRAAMGVGALLGGGGLGGLGGAGGAGQSPFGLMMLGALANILGGGGQGGVSPFGGFPGGAANAFPNGPSGVGSGGRNYKPGSAGPGGGSDDVTGILNDPSLTVEDKITLMLMAIMKKMDKEIEEQAQNINKMQQQQNKSGGGKGGGGGGKGGGGKGGGGGGGSNPSIDVESQKLSRLVQKRNQMFDILRQIIDKYNETAKNIIQSMGR